jgi:hypothetical protein
MENEQELSAVWRERLEAQQASGLSVAAWCKQAGVSAWSVYAWRKRLSSPTSVPATAKLIRMPVAGMAPAPMLELQTPGGYVLRLSSAEQVSWPPAILAALR